MNWRNALRRLSPILGLISLALAFMGGRHYEHILADGGGRHVGETLTVIILSLLMLAMSWYGARLIKSSQSDTAGG